MRGGTLNKFRTFSFVGLMAVTGGCDTSAALPTRPVQVSAAPQIDAPEARSQTDLARNRVWLLNSEGVFLQEGAAPLKKLQLPDWHWAGAPYGCLPDLALGPKGEAVITSDVLPTLWRIDPETLAVSKHPLALDADTDKDVGFSGLTYSAMQGVYFAVSHAQGSLWRIDRAFTRAQKIPLSEPVPGAYGLTARQNDARGRATFLAGLCASTPAIGSGALPPSPPMLAK